MFFMFQRLREVALKGSLFAAFPGKRPDRYFSGFGGSECLNATVRFQALGC